MTESDDIDRCVALTDFDAVLMVEAAAGTGKTSLLSGRVALMLASGIEPREIVAVTFTEPSAAELLQRIEQTVEELLARTVPIELKPALTRPLDDKQIETLRRAKGNLDELTATTIHGFCLSILRAHAIDFGQDPGARVIEEETADELFAEEVSGWLNDRLGQHGDPQDPIAILAVKSPKDVVNILRELAKLRKEHRAAGFAQPRKDIRPDHDFHEAVDAFCRWQPSSSVDDRNIGLARDLCALAEPYELCLDTALQFERLWELAQPVRSRCMSKDRYALHHYGGALDAYGAIEFPNIDPQGQRLYAEVDRTWRALLGYINQCLLSQIYGSVEEVLARYDARKRRAAALDFDDLIALTRRLLHDNPAVRQLVAERHPRLLIDEFQDTDPDQIDVAFTIASASTVEHWWQSDMRRGSLFLVGDPRQAIYRWRGADIETYERAQNVVVNHARGKLLHVTANFRSRCSIIDYVNRTFEPILSRQTEYTPLVSTVDDAPKLAPVQKLTIPTAEDAWANEVRDAEAAEVAKACAGLIGSFEVRRKDGTIGLAGPGDIALLSPGHAELWRYVRELEKWRIPTASEAGKALMTRQETQDFLALTRVLADPSDTLAFGALMRGPLVGLSEDDLLDITAALPSRDDGLGPRFSVLTEPADIVHPLARDIVQTLAGLRRLAGKTAPSVLLATAIEELNVRAIVGYRHRQREARALSNIDRLIDRARAYDVRGLRAFAQDLTRDWRDRTSRIAEGRSDATKTAVNLVTMHRAKGLEWPIVFVVNTATQFRRPDQFVYLHRDRTIHWTLGDVVHPDLETAKAEEAEATRRQNERLWYVGCTRARDLLVLSRLSAKANSWAGVVDLGLDGLYEFDRSRYEARALPPRDVSENSQTRRSFAEGEATIAAAVEPIVWLRPSQHDPDIADSTTPPLIVDEEMDDVGAAVTGGGRIRGELLHKLMEELVVRVLAPDRAAVGQRAIELIGQLEGAGRPVAGIIPSELTDTIFRTLELDVLKRWWDHLVAEVQLWGTFGGRLLSGRADAIAWDGDDAKVVFDWKSDVAVTPAVVTLYEKQLRDYMRATGAQIGVLVFMTSGRAVTIEDQRH